MDLEQRQEWDKLEVDAMRLVRAGNWYLRLGVFPSFSDPQVLGLRGSRHHSSKVVWRKWCRAADAEKLRSPVERLRHPPQLAPTVEERQAIFDSLRAGALIEALSQLALPLVPPATSIGLDGTRYEVLARDGSHSVHLQWWEDTPREWHSLMRWFEAAWRDLSDSLDIPQPNRIAGPL